MYLVQGLENNRFARISKTHHALVDGVSGVDLATVLFDANPVPVRLTPPVRPWKPKPQPQRSTLLARGAEGVAKMPLRIGRRLMRAAQHPRQAVEHLINGGGGRGRDCVGTAEPRPRRAAQPGDRAAPALRVGALAPRRLQAIAKDAFGGTVNDVVLAVTAGALRTWLHDRGTDAGSRIAGTRAGQHPHQGHRGLLATGSPSSARLPVTRRTRQRCGSSRIKWPR